MEISLVVPNIQSGETLQGEEFGAFKVFKNRQKDNLSDKIPQKYFQEILKHVLDFLLLESI